MAPDDKKLQPIKREETFNFACHPDVPCFTECCRRLTLMLTPYDVVRLRRELSLSSSEFIDRYTRLEFQSPSGFPVLFLEMEKNDEKTCPFLVPEGCMVYKSRPSACRIYPVARATKFHAVHGTLSEAFYLIREEHCLGFEQKRCWTISEWLKDQELETYLKKNDEWTEIVMHPSLRSGISSQQKQFAYTMCYNLDVLKRIVSSGRLETIFDLDEHYCSTLEKDEFELLDFGLQWLKFALLGKTTLKLRKGK